MANERPIDRLKARAKTLKHETYALYLAVREPGVPWYAKALAALVVGYALSPIDLIPDFIPILGYLDDLVLIPAGIALAVKLIPAETLAACRTRAETELAGRKLTSKTAAAVVILLWLLVLGLVARAIFL
ncbi:MAG: DUF1232 domain-containing protein [Spirochaetaceae bacterium]|nr:DUF1232 domain-containing protein [Spirochaetaceae bacterium]